MSYSSGTIITHPVRRYPASTRYRCEQGTYAPHEYVRCTVPRTCPVHMHQEHTVDYSESTGTKPQARGVRRVVGTLHFGHLVRLGTRVDRAQGLLGHGFTVLHHGVGRSDTRAEPCKYVLPVRVRYACIVLIIVDVRGYLSTLRDPLRRSDCLQFRSCHLSPFRSCHHLRKP